MLNSAFRAVFTVLIIGLLLRAVGWHNLLDAFGYTELPWLLGMYVLLIINRVVQAAQMQLILGKVGHRLRLGRIFLANSLSVLYSFILPGDMLAGVAKWANLSAATGKKSVVLNAIIYNRLVLLIPPLVLGAGALALENPFSDSLLSEALIVFAAAALAAVVFIFHPKYGAVTDRIVRKMTDPLPNAIGSRIHSVRESLIDFRAFRLRDHLHVYSIGIFSMFMNLLVFSCATKAMGLSISFHTLAWVMALLLSSRQLPITLCNLGIREGILMAVLSPYEAEPERAFVLGLIMFSWQIIMAFVGLSYQIAFTFGIAQWKSYGDQ